MIEAFELNQHIEVEATRAQRRAAVRVIVIGRHGDTVHKVLDPNAARELAGELSRMADLAEKISNF